MELDYTENLQQGPLGLFETYNDLQQRSTTEIYNRDLEQVPTFSLGSCTVAEKLSQGAVSPQKLPAK